MFKHRRIEGNRLLWALSVLGVMGGMTLQYRYCETAAIQVQRGRVLTDAQGKRSVALSPARAPNTVIYSQSDTFRRNWCGESTIALLWGCVGYLNSEPKRRVVDSNGRLISQGNDLHEVLGREMLDLQLLTS